MNRALLTCGFLFAGFFAGFGLVDGGASAIPEASAGEPAGPQDVTNASCVITGKYPPAKGAKIFDQSTGGNIIASLSGAYIPMTLTAIPFDPSTFRAKIKTALPKSSDVAISGYVSPSDVSLFTAQDISVQGATVWISSAQKVKLVRANSTSLTVEMTIGGTLNQTVRATAPCEAFSLSKGKPTPIELPEKGRSYMTKKEKVVLYEQPSGNAVFTLNMMEGTGQLFWGDKVRQGFVHVIARNDLTIDGWVPLKDLDPVKKGEMVDQYIPPTTQVSGAKLGFDKPPATAKAEQNIPIRAKREDNAPIIGFIEQGAEFYVLETVAGWTNIMPKHLGVLPPDDGGFWIPASELPK